LQVNHQKVLVQNVRKAIRRRLSMLVSEHADFLSTVAPPITEKLVCVAYVAGIVVMCWSDWTLGAVIYENLHHQCSLAVTGTEQLHFFSVVFTFAILVLSNARMSLYLSS